MVWLGAFKSTPACQSVWLVWAQFLVTLNKFSRCQLYGQRNGTNENNGRVKHRNVSHGPEQWLKSRKRIQIE